MGLGAVLRVKEFKTCLTKKIELGHCNEVVIQAGRLWIKDVTGVRVRTLVAWETELLKGNGE